jgi:hypothetical protein
MNAEETVFTIPELRLYILKYLIYPYKCLNCGYIPKKKIYVPKHTIYICEWCNPYAYTWNVNTMDLSYY